MKIYPKIHLLSKDVVNHIAAGELIKRPSSIIKELLENSIDAKSNIINIDVKNGGKKFLSVSDNGHGIRLEDLKLALSRYSTSKINNLQDLDTLSSLGFRGEALASISSFANILLTSRTYDMNEAWQIEKEVGENNYNIYPIASSTIGTKVEVSDLFFSFPARKNFLRTATIEFNYIKKVVISLALANFNIAFSLKHNGKLIFSLSQAHDELNKNRRIRKICGNNFFQHTLPIISKYNDVKLWGWIGIPIYSHNNPDLQYLYINNRLIKHSLISSAIREAYSDVLYKNRYPIFILFLHLDPKMIDFNVHPSKKTVNIRNQSIVYKYVFETLKNCLTKFRPKHQLSLIKTHSSESEKNNNTQQVFSNIKIPPLGFAIGTLKGIYIISENSIGLVLIDIHAAHERIIYETLKSNLENKKKIQQKLLIPQIIRVNPHEANCINNFYKFFIKLGFSLKHICPETILISAIPALLIQSNIIQLIYDIIYDLSKFQNSNILEKYYYKIIQKFSCSTALKAKCNMTLLEMNNLLRNIENTVNSSQCNHGRPTWIQLKLNDLDKLFLRGR